MLGRQVETETFPDFSETETLRKRFQDRDVETETTFLVQTINTSQFTSRDRSNSPKIIIIDVCGSEDLAFYRNFSK